MNDDSEVVDFRLVCRTCLVSDAVFYKLEAPINNEKGGDKSTTYKQCLHFITRLEDRPELPIYICTQCSAALQVAYNFIRNALEAHEILCQQLSLAPHPQTQHRNNGKLEMMSTPAEKAPMRFRCKICQEKLDSKRSLKEHLKNHMDIITYSCRMCEFDTKKRSHLGEHYQSRHNMQATRDLLKANTVIDSSKEYANTDRPSAQPDSLMMQMELIHNSTAATNPTEAFPHASSELSAQGAQQDRPQSPVYIESNLLMLNAPPAQRPSSRQSKEQENQVLSNFTPAELIMPPQVQFNEADGQVQQLVLRDRQDVATLLPHQLNCVGTLLSSESESAVVNGVPAESMEVSATDISHYANGEYNLCGNEMSIGNEFVVMEDGTVEEVIGNGVVIEYINAPNDGGDAGKLDDRLVFGDMLHLQTDNASAGGSGTMVDMTLEDIIIDETASTSVLEEQIKQIGNASSIEDEIPSTVIHGQPVSKKIKCKICAEYFATQEKLKTHMLSHNEIPHFFCDQCPFYTFFKIDLTQHYKTKHRVYPTNKQLQPRNKGRNMSETRNLYCCDLCLFETRVKANLRRHYSLKHRMEANDVQLRPVSVDGDYKTVTEADVRASNKGIKLDYPTGLNCRKCKKVFFWRSKLRDHYREHTIQECEQLRLMEVAAVSAVAVANVNNNNNAPKECASHAHMDPETSNAVQHILPAVHMEIAGDGDGEGNGEMDGAGNINNNPHTNNTTTSNNSSAANNIEFDMNGDVLFDDFEEDDNEAHDDLSNLQLTSDDDFEEMLQNGTQAAQICVQCNKKFYSQYQFENHTFVHRGLAPYRCEMCTNLYNTKRALIRHYKAVHKKIPTRDMIQAKGDKASDNTPLHQLDLQENSVVPLMCARCPYESIESSHLQLHLNTSHGIQETGSFILQKLPFECPRCIRTYATKQRLLQHLERGHSSMMITQRQVHRQQSDEVNTTRSRSPSISTSATASASVSTSASDSVCSTPSPAPSYIGGPMGLRVHATANQIPIKSHPEVHVPSSATVAAVAATTTMAATKSISLSCSSSSSPVSASASACALTSTAVSAASSSGVRLANSSISSRGILESSKGPDNVGASFQIDATASYVHVFADSDAAISDYAATVNVYTEFDAISSAVTLSDIDENANASASANVSGIVNGSGNGDVDTCGVAGAILQCQASGCLFTCETSAQLDLHTRNFHIHETIREYFNFKCDVCQCRYKTLFHLRLHMKRHNARNFPCPHCPKTFTTRTELMHHKKLHMGVLSYKCDECSKCFGYAHHLKRHKDILHRGKRYLCNEPNCGRFFTSRNQLKNHTMSHTGRFPYKCQTCNYGFKKRECLRLHAMKVHKIILTEQEIAENYRHQVGHTNPHDFTITLSNGKTSRRSDAAGNPNLNTS